MSLVELYFAIGLIWSIGAIYIYFFEVRPDLITVQREPELMEELVYVLGMVTFTTVFWPLSVIGTILNILDGE